MKPQDATTPARHLYFTCMMAYIDPANLEQHQAALLEKARSAAVGAALARSQGSLRYVRGKRWRWAISTTR
ncbi:flagellar biosynthesis repressor FlbT [Novosphingobium colocasiae]